MWWLGFPACWSKAYMNVYKNVFQSKVYRLRNTHITKAFRIYGNCYAIWNLYDPHIIWLGFSDDLDLWARFSGTQVCSNIMRNMNLIQLPWYSNWSRYCKDIPVIVCTENEVLSFSASKLVVWPDIQTDRNDWNCYLLAYVDDNETFVGYKLDLRQITAK